MDIDDCFTVWFFKPVGWNPSDCVTHLKKDSNYSDKRVAFAGRLDPMAYGLLPLIISSKTAIQNQCNKHNVWCNKHQGCYKTYRFSMIEGLQTDSYDILGVVSERIQDTLSIEERIKIEVTKKSQFYPIYSSKTVHSPYHNKQMPLWKLAKENRLPAELPQRDTDIEYINLLGSDIIDDINEIINPRFNSLLSTRGFPLQDIQNSWDKLTTKTYKIYHFEARVSTGTYIRTIVNNFGGVAYDIFRTSVGDFTPPHLEEMDKFCERIL